MADANPKDSGPQDPTPVALEPESPIDSGWQDFCQTHESWLTRFAQTNPLYRLPPMVITSLESSRRLDAQAVQAERDLARRCKRSGLNGRPIIYSLLFGRPPKGLGSATWTTDQLPAQHPRREQLAKQATKIFERMKGYAGWLLTEPAFDNDIESLKQQWSDLCLQNYIQFPLLRTSFLPGKLPEGLPELITPQGEKFAAAFVAFCDRWALTGMASWELPQPQPLLLLSPPLQKLPHVPSNVLHIILPVYYPLPRNHDLIRELRTRQNDLAKQANIPSSIAGLCHFRFYAQLLAVFHLERVISSRYGPAKRYPGFVGDLKIAISRACRVKADQLDRYRKAISARRRGRPDRIPKFRPRS
jgi:hypothetical protein